MLRYFLLCLALVACVASAQTTPGISLGGNFGRIAHNGWLSNDPLPSYTAGLTFINYFGDHGGLVSDFYFNRWRTQINDSIYPVSRIDWTLAYHYFITPLREHVETGPFFTLPFTNPFISFERVGDQDQASASDVINGPLDESGFRFGWMVGVGYGSESWRIRLRYWHQFKNLVKNVSGADDLSARHQLLTLTFSYYFLDVIVF